RHGIHRVAGTESRERGDFERYREFHLRPCALWWNVPCKGRKRQRDAAANIRGSIRQLHALSLGAGPGLRCLDRECGPAAVRRSTPTMAMIISRSAGLA